MKVAHLLPLSAQTGGGLVQCVRRLAYGLQTEQSVPIKVFAPLNSSQADRSFWEPLNVAFFPVLGPESFRYSPGLAQAVDNSHADVVHSHGLWTFLSLVTAKWHRRTNKPYVVSPHGMLDPWALENSKWKKVIAGLVYERNHLARANCLHALSSAEVKAIRDYGLSNPICLIPNGVDVPMPSHVESRPPWVEHVVDERKIFLFLSRIHPKKGLTNLIQAWSKLHASADGSRTLAKWALCIAGWDEGGHEAYLKEQVRELGLSGEIHFLGPLIGGDRDAAFRHADAFVLPSLSEGLPVAVLEAWAFGLPVIMTRQCNLPEGEQTAAAITEDATVEGMMSALQRLTALDQSELKLMGLRGHRLALERFNWANVAAEMRNVYEWVNGAAERPSCVFLS